MPFPILNLFDVLSTMKSIEDFDLNNMELAMRYLSGRLTLDEEIEFELRLKVDEELQDDLDMVKEHMGFEPKPKVDEVDLLLRGYSIDEDRAKRKALVGKDLITYGIGAALVAVLMTLTCIVFFKILGGS